MYLYANLDRRRVLFYHINMNTKRLQQFMRKKIVNNNVIKLASVALAALLLFSSAVRPVYAGAKAAKKAYILDETTRLSIISDAFNATNAKRQLAGLPQLTWSQELFNAAEIRSYEIVVLFDHVRPDGTICVTAAPGILLGENILEGNTARLKTGAGSVDAFMSCEEHKENILYPSGK